MEKIEHDVYAIELQNISFLYKRNKCILRNVNFSMEQKSILTILGPNGAGKTTLLNCILKNISGYSGSIKLFGKELKKYSAKEFASIVAYVPQLSQLNFDYTVEEFILMGCNPHKPFLSQPEAKDYELVDKSLTELGIVDLKTCLMGEISGGERQLVYIARALTQRPKVIIMDEPTSALDYSNQYKIIKILKNLNAKGYSIVLTSHNPEYAYMLGGYAALLFKGGRFLFGHVEELMTEEYLTEMYNTSIKVMYIPEYDSYICMRID